jgi:hypothetical protein
MTDLLPEDRDYASAFDGFMAEVNGMSASPGGPTLGARLLKTHPFSRNDPRGIMLATFCAKLPNQERAKNFAGMITCLTSFYRDDQAWMLIEYHDDKGFRRIEFLTADFIRLTPFCRESGGYRFTVDANGILVKEEIIHDETAKLTEESHAASPSGTPPVP